MKKVLVVILMISLAGFAFARDSGETGSEEGGMQKTAVARPWTDEETHCVGQLYFTVSNWGFFGSKRPSSDCIPDEVTGNCRPSGEYPGGSGKEYLFQGALWIGAVAAGDTLVSIGEDGWLSNINELHPSCECTDEYCDTLMYRTILEPDKYPDAVSEEDYVGGFTDTVKNPSYVDPTHRPLGIAVHQESYAWSYDYAKNFVFIDYTFTNIRQDNKPIEETYIGIYVDGDCGHVDLPNYAQDDITGFIENYIDQTTAVPDTIPVMLAWIADNDGDPDDRDEIFNEYSVTGAMAVRVLRGPWGTSLDSASANFSFNWWISNSDEDYDWGPCRTGSDCEDGTPLGDLSKYCVMSNGEFDYNQTDAPDSANASAWSGCPPPENIDNIANGYDTRFLLSFGPMTIDTGESVKVTIAFLVGENFHQNPLNCGGVWDPDEFNFDDLAYAAYWISIIFDNPGVDTDTNGYAGEYEIDPLGDTIWLTGDGVPDYKGPTPPPAPDVKIVSGENKVTLYWLCGEGEDVVDEITKVQDFEGYRVYIAEANLDEYFVSRQQYDRVDYLKYSVMTRVFDSLDTGGDSVFHCIGRYSNQAVTDTNEYTINIITTVGDTVGDTTLVPEPIDYNVGMPPQTTIQLEGDDTAKCYYYYTFDNLLPGDDKYVVVTAFDYGQPSKNLSSLESSRTNYSKWIVPTGAATGDKKVKVVPNPYRVDHDYSDFWEFSYTGEWNEYDRKLRFYNIPAKCKIRIFTLDGDMVCELEHDDKGDKKMAGAEDWNLISKNGQSVASGIYVFSVEDSETGDVQIGKFVIIK